jgi:hypothetical protein
LSPQRLALAEAALCCEAEVAAPVAFEIVRTAHCRVADFPSGAAFTRGDELTSVVAPLEGAFRGVAMIGMDPEAILRTLAPLRGPAVPDAWCETATAVLRAVAARLGEVKCGPGRLHDGSLVEAVVDTHAPANVAVLSAEARVAGEVAAICLLVDPKELGPGLFAVQDAG